jgi:hypothetical protein
MERVLAESPRILLVHEFEQVFVVDREAGFRHQAGDHYGDPAFGVIAPDESWAATGGEGVVVWQSDGRISEFLRDNVSHGQYHAVTAMRVEDVDTLLVETEDPVSGGNVSWRIKPRVGEVETCGTFAG